MARFASLVIICAAAAFAAPTALKTLSTRIDDRKHCVIKGNISIPSGERIYHVPGQKYYVPTKISWQYGERWFCTEAEARAAGWRKAKR